jgi:hypothetical protein
MNININQIFFKTLPLLALFFCLNLHGQQKVQTGVYLLNMYDMNMDEHSFYADFYVWFRWKGAKDPTNIEFVNSVEKWGMTNVPFGDTLTTLKSGEKYKIIRVEGRFFHSFGMARFPLDEHVLDIQIENPEFPADSLVYVPDTSTYLIRNTLNLVGWQMKGANLESKVHDYGTNFGNAEENAQKFSNLTYTLTISRPFTYFSLKMMLPLLIVMLVSIGALLLHPSYIDTRSSLPIGGLLTAVFLQQSYNSALPDTGYMVLMDKIYLLCYLIISLVLWQVVVAGNWLMKKNPLPDEIIIKKEKRLAFLYVLLFGLGVLVLCL